VGLALARKGSLERPALRLEYDKGNLFLTGTSAELHDLASRIDAAAAASLAPSVSAS